MLAADDAVDVLPGEHASVLRPGLERTGGERGSQLPAQPRVLGRIGTDEDGEAAALPPVGLGGREPARIRRRGGDVVPPGDEPDIALGDVADRIVRPQPVVERERIADRRRVVGIEGGDRRRARGEGQPAGSLSRQYTGGCPVRETISLISTSISGVWLHIVRKAPSTGIVTPLMNSESSLARNTAHLAMSSGCP